MACHNVGVSYSNGPRCQSVSLSVSLFVCHMWISLKLSGIDLCLLWNRNRNLGFPSQDMSSDYRKHGSDILGVSGLALHPFRQKWAGWASECSEWISRNSHQLAPHWAPWRTSYRHVPQRTIPCFYFVRQHPFNTLLMCTYLCRSVLFLLQCKMLLYGFRLH